MKIFISADMEGITSTASWSDCDASSKTYDENKVQMTNEVVAACQGAIEAGATEIVIKDAHDAAQNIDITKLPECVKLIRGWSGHPNLMVQGIDDTFDAVFFIGYHSAAGSQGNPLSHTISLNPVSITINGEQASEFTIYSYAAARLGVPTVFLSGDKMLCDTARTMHPAIFTVAVKEGEGASTICKSPKETLRLIKQETERSLRQDLDSAKIILPNEYNVEIILKDHTYADKISYFPGIVKKSNNILSFRTNDYYEVLRTLKFII